MIMPGPRRLLAFMVNVLLLHVMWVGSGFACDMPDMGAPTAAVGMADMEMPAEAMAAMDTPGISVQPSSEAPAHDHAPCELPWAQDGCQSMAPCAPLAVASPVESLRLADHVLSAVESQLFLTPPSQVRTPELPPPRA